MRVNETMILRSSFFKSFVDKIVFRLNLKVEKANKDKVRARANKSYKIDEDILRLKVEFIGSFYYKIYLSLGSDIVFTIWVFENRVDCYNNRTNIVSLKVDVFNNPLAGDDVYYYIMDNLKGHL